MIIVLPMEHKTSPTQIHKSLKILKNFIRLV